MKILGIIAEYNPFHNGHKYHIEKSLEITGADGVIAVMSGNFTQRGEPAAFDKWLRAEIAVRNGADIVFELPFAYAVNSADNFAKGGIGLLNSLGCVDYVSFGSEVGELDAIQKAARLLASETEDFKAALKYELDKGNSYPAARMKAMEELLQSNLDILKSPNNILAVEYLKYLEIYDSAIQPITIKRLGQAYNDCAPSVISGDECDNGGSKFASASAIRRSLAESIDINELSNVLSNETICVLKQVNDTNNIKLNDFYQLIAYQLLNRSADDLAEVYAVSEGIENKLKQAVREACNIESLIDSVISKRYTRTRIQRMLIQILLDFKRSDFELIDNAGAMYGHVLAFSEKGAKILKKIRKSDNRMLPLITNVNKYMAAGEAEQKLLSYDMKASDLYNFVSGKNVYRYSDYLRTPFGTKLIRKQQGL